MPCYNGSKPTCQPQCATPGPEIAPVYRSLAVAHVTNQPYGSPTYDIETALIRGTIYKDLDKPFLGKGGCNR